MCLCERAKGARRREEERQIVRRGREERGGGERRTQKERERKGEETKGRENAEEGERGRKECMGTRRKRADRDLPVPHSTNAKASSPALSAP